MLVVTANEVENAKLVNNADVALFAKLANSANSVMRAKLV